MSDTYLEDLQRVRNAVKNTLLVTQDRSKPNFGKAHLSLVFTVGDFVMLDHPPNEAGASRKLSIKFRGPYKVIRQLTNQNYEIARLIPPYDSQIVHFKRLKSIVPRYEYLSTYDPGIGSRDLENPVTDPVGQARPDPGPIPAINKRTVTTSSDQRSPTGTRSGRKVRPPARLDI